MITLRILFAVLISALVAHSVQAQGFRNLGFEEADLTNLTGGTGSDIGFGPIEELLPGWDLHYLRNGQILGRETTMFLNSSRLTPNVVYLSSNPGGFHPETGEFVATSFEGRYRLSFSLETVGASLTQRGRVPDDAFELRFDYLDRAPGVLVDAVRLFDTLPHNPKPFPEVMTAVFDVSRFRGQEVELQLVLDAGGQLDNVRFIVPEPSTVALLLVGGGLVAISRLRRRRGP